MRRIFRCSKRRSCSAFLISKGVVVSCQPQKIRQIWLSEICMNWWQYARLVRAESRKYHKIWFRFLHENRLKKKTIANKLMAIHTKAAALSTGGDEENWLSHMDFTNPNNPNKLIHINGCCGFMTLCVQKEVCHTVCAKQMVAATVNRWRGKTFKWKLVFWYLCSVLLMSTSWTVQIRNIWIYGSASGWRQLCTGGEEKCKDGKDLLVSGLHPFTQSC